jgi:hypothetical protein
LLCRTAPSRQIDDETIVAAAETRSVVSAAADRDQEILSAAKVHRRYHVSHVRAARNEARTLVDHAVVKLARLVIAVITRLNRVPRNDCASNPLACLSSMTVTSPCGCFVRFRKILREESPAQGA